jgi:preprotein translocase subunit SecE
MLASFGGIVAKSKRKRNVNPIVAYFRSTRAELRKVRWPTLEQGWSMTKIVLVVTFGMAIFLGVLDFFFGWLLGQVVAGSAIFIVLGILVVAAMLAAAYFIGQGEEV